jgi:signal transduction histidine kinase
MPSHSPPWNQAPGLLAVVDARSGSLLECNPLAEQIGASLSAWTRASALTRLIGDAGRAAEALAQVHAGGCWRHLTLLHGPQGPRWYQLELKALDAHRGKSPQALLSGHDVHELIEGRLELERQLSQAQVRAQAQADLAAHLAHEMRTPLAGVISLTELVLGSELNERQRKLLDLSLQSGRGLLDLLNHSLDLAKLEAGGVTLEQAPFALHDCLKQALQPLLPQAHAKGLKLVARVQPGVPHQLLGDALRLRQVIVNLVGNALKFTAKGEVRVDIQRADWPELMVAPGSGMRLSVAITDTGPGMSTAQQEALFKPYAQADVSIARRFGGTGLGLSIAQRLVAQMGGQIQVESAPGVGSCFRFEFETQRAPAGASAAITT